jgi:hypothetical protein
MPDNVEMKECLFFRFFVLRIDEALGTVGEDRFAEGECFLGSDRSFFLPVCFTLIAFTA